MTGEIKSPYKQPALSASSKKLNALFNSKYPIIQAPTGGVVSSDLIAAVTNSGGIEAGGHVHASRPLEEALYRVLQVAGDVPVVASKESAAHLDYKKSLVDTNSEDTVFTTCMNKGWDNGPHRILRNSTFENWEAMGCPKSGTRPGEDDIVARYSSGHEITRYSITSPNKSISGNIEALANYAGMGVDDIEDIPTVKKIIDNIWQDFLQSAAKLS